MHTLHGTVSESKFGIWGASFRSEISLFLENIEQYQDNCKWSLDISGIGVAHTAMVHPSPHPGWFMEQALLSWMQTPECCERSFY